MSNLDQAWGYIHRAKLITGKIKLRVHVEAFQTTGLQLATVSACGCTRASVLGAAAWRLGILNILGPLLLAVADLVQVRLSIAIDP